MNYIAILIKFSPLLWSVVTGIEAQMQDSPGKVKLDAAIAFINEVEPALASEAPAVTKLIGGIVAAANTSGLFKKSGAPDA